MVELKGGSESYVEQEGKSICTSKAQNVIHNKLGRGVGLVGVFFFFLSFLSPPPRPCNGLFSLLLLLLLLLTFLMVRVVVDGAVVCVKNVCDFNPHTAPSRLLVLFF